MLTRSRRPSVVAYRESLVREREGKRRRTLWNGNWEKERLLDRSSWSGERKEGGGEGRRYVAGVMNGTGEERTVRITTLETEESDAATLALPR